MKSKLALKLHDVDGFEQIEAVKMMGISQPIFTRILGVAHKKVSGAIVFGKAIRID